MPVGYTELYARKLDELSNLTVKEAQEGDLIAPGTAYLAAAGRHLSFRKSGASVVAHLDVRPLDTAHRPAVDVLFHSAADVFGSRVMGVVMTGMGSDGREGSAWIKARGGQILTETEQSCVVYGMPRSVVEAGLSDTSASLETMFDVILERL
jgi:two-component system chemotaxis response regulator CheB